MNLLIAVPVKANLTEKLYDRLMVTVADLHEANPTATLALHRQQSIGSLGSVMPGNEYNVVISGMHKTGQLFGGGEKITIIN